MLLTLRHSTMKLEKYDGTTSMDSFLAKYEVCASHNRWSEQGMFSTSQMFINWTGGSNSLGYGIKGNIKFCGFG